LVGLVVCRSVLGASGGASVMSRIESVVTPRLKGAGWIVAREVGLRIRIAIGMMSRRATTMAKRIHGKEDELLFADFSNAVMERHQETTPTRRETSDAAANPSTEPIKVMSGRF